MHKRLKDRGFHVIAISVDEERSNIDAFVKKHALPFRVVHDAKGDIVSRYEPPKMPTSYLIGPHGKLVQVYAGFNNDIHKDLEEKVNKLLKELKPSEKDAGDDKTKPTRPDATPDPG